MVGLSSAPVVSIKPSRTASGRAFRAVCDYSRPRPGRHDPRPARGKSGSGRLSYYCRVVVGRYSSRRRSGFPGVSEGEFATTGPPRRLRINPAPPPAKHPKAGPEPAGPEAPPASGAIS